MAGTRQAALVAVLLSGWLAGASAGYGETIPLPRPAPFPKEGAVAAQPAPEPEESGISAILGHLFSGKPATPDSAFDASQRALVNKVSAYLSSIQTLTGKFVQIGPDGRRTTGELYIQKPGKVRFEYDPPSPIEIIADGQSVVVRDTKLGTQDPYKLSQTPLRYLLADRIDLLHDTNVVDVSADETFVTITIKETQALIGTSRLMVSFDAKSFKLKQWTITDPQGFDTTVAVSNLDSSKRPDPNLFKIDFTRYVQ